MTFYSLVIAVAMLPAVLAQSLQVNTPPSVNRLRCKYTTFSALPPLNHILTSRQWSGGSPPYFLSFVPAGEPGATPLKQFPSQSGNSVTWNTDLPTGTLFTITLRDGTGAVAFSDKVAVQPGPDSSNGAASGGNGSDTTSAGPSTGGGTANPGNANAGGNSTGGAPSPPAPAHSSNGVIPAAQLSPIPHPASASAAAPSKIKSNNASELKGVDAWLMVGLTSLIGVLLF
ncbi:hypothetical protein BU17DRAFT_93672 [Hysterangium stoloniferum]|nr:hypothetical protein BU17DRAFT_93672 [Hysterangium stoloniferum]